MIISSRTDGDTIGASLSLRAALVKQKKQVCIVIPGKIPATYSFLDTKNIRTDVQGKKELVISIDTTNIQAKEINYKTSPEKLQIFVSPKDQCFTEQDVSVRESSCDFDLIVAIGMNEIDDVGSIYEDNAGFFYETPIVNIDHRASNGNFGKINLIDIATSSVSEIILEVIEELDKEAIDEKVATSLLTGIIYSTDSFQNQNTSPKTFTLAARLISLGAQQQDIIRHLYKTKSISTLKLWGRVLARAKYDPTNKMVWSLVELEDFQKSKAEPEDLFGVAEEVISTIPNAWLALIITQISPTKVRGLVYSIKNTNALEIARIFGGQGNEKQAEFELEKKDLLEAEKDILSKIKAPENKDVFIESEEKTKPLSA